MLFTLSGALPIFQIRFRSIFGNIFLGHNILLSKDLIYKFTKNLKTNQDFKKSNN